MQLIKSAIFAYNLNLKYVNVLHILNLHVRFVRNASKHCVGIV